MSILQYSPSTPCRGAGQPSKLGTKGLTATNVVDAVKTVPFQDRFRATNRYHARTVALDPMERSLRTPPNLEKEDTMLPRRLAWFAAIQIFAVGPSGNIQAAPLVKIHGEAETYRLLGGKDPAIGMSLTGEAARDIYVFLNERIAADDCSGRKGPSDLPQFVVGDGITCIRNIRKGSVDYSYSCQVTIRQADGMPSKQPMVCP